MGQCAGQAVSVEQVALKVVDTLNGAGIPYALVGSFTSNRWQ